MINIKDSVASGVFRNFDKISRIPRCSGNEENIANFIYEFGKNLGYDVKKDKYNNVLILKPATEGYEDSETVVLQAHTDMVCEKTEDSNHDFCKDPIVTKVNGDFIKADKTTLGADDGIGVAIIMDILEDKTLCHPNIEAIFTATEETGMDGAIGLSENWLTGKRLINIDTEDDNVIIVGCAGGVNATLTIEREVETIDNLKNCKIEVSGLKGGHSGLTIGEAHLNSVKVLNEVIMKLKQKYDLHLEIFEGGSKHNAIPVKAYAVIGVEENLFDDFKNDFYNIVNEIKENFLKREADMTFGFKEHNGEGSYLTKQTLSNFLRLIQLFPHGINTMDENGDLVQSSNNLAIVKFSDDKIDILTSIRSSKQNDMDVLKNTIEGIASITNAKIVFSEGYPMWEPDFQSELLNTAKSVYKELRGEEVIVSTIHAGLETGILSKKYPNIKMISTGPNITGAHTPEEKLSIKSTEFMVKYIRQILTKL